MRNFLIALFLLFIAFIVLIQASFIDLPDRLVAYSIPRYPNATEWVIHSQTAVIEGSTGADIDSQTSDSTENMIIFYKDKLGKLGWKQDISPKNSYYEIPGAAEFSRKILFWNFHIGMIGSGSDNRKLFFITHDGSTGN